MNHSVDCFVLGNRTASANSDRRFLPETQDAGEEARLESGIPAFTIDFDLVPEKPPFHGPGFPILPIPEEAMFFRTRWAP